MADICRGARALAQEGGVPAQELERVRALALVTFRDVMEGRATPAAL